MDPSKVILVIGGDASVVTQVFADKTKFIRIQNYEMLMEVINTLSKPGVLNTEMRTVVWEHDDESQYEIYRNPMKPLIRLLHWNRFYNTGYIFAIKHMFHMHPLIIQQVDYFVIFKDDSYEIFTYNSDTVQKLLATVYEDKNLCQNGHFA
jgi:hypothetical protein